MKSIQIGKEDGKLSLFTDNMTSYTENSQSLQRSYWWANIKFIKVAGNKINTNWIYTPAMNNPKRKLRKHACLLNCFSRVWLFATLWTVLYQAPLSMGFSRKEYWSGLPFPFPGVYVSLLYRLGILGFNFFLFS